MNGRKNIKVDRKPLSTAAIKGMKPGCKDLSDVGENAGLRVSCGSTGTKAYYYRYRNPFDNKKTISMTFGHYPLMGLADARTEFQKLKSIRKSGRCPKTERVDQALLAEQARLAIDEEQKSDSFTVKDMVELYLTQYIEDRFVADERSPGKRVKVDGARKPKGQSECRRTLEGDAVRVLGDIPASKITRKDVVRLIDAIIQRGANVQAGNVLRELNSAYEYAIGMEYLPDDFSNPALQAKEALKRTKVKLTSNRGSRFFTDQELVKFLRWLPGSGFSNNHKNVMRLTLCTGLRTGVVCAAEWSEIDLEKATWFVSTEKSKTDTDQWVQLPRQAVEYLRQLKLVTNEYLIPSSWTGLPIEQKTLTEMKWHLKNPDKLKNRRKFRSEQLWLDTIPDWAPHDLRRTVRTGLARLGCSSEVAEAVLGHSKKGIEGTYNLHRYEAECRIWLQKWADHLDKLMEE